MMTLSMNTPVWVWLYDFGSHNYPEMWKDASENCHCHPQAHTYAFLSEKDALEHPKNMKWANDHKYVLQKVYIN